MAEKSAKQTAVIQTVKAIAVLVIICLVCVALLALLNDLLYVAPPAADDAIAAIHEDFERDTNFDETLNDEFKKNDTYGEVLSVARCKNDGAIILETIGYNGYQGGTVTLYVVVSSEAKILGWAIKDNVNQSYINLVPSNAGSTWYVGEEITKELDLDMTGATVTYTSTAIWNAVNMAAYYSRMALAEEFGLGEIVDPAAVAEEAAKALLADTIYSSYTLKRFSSITINGKTLADTLTDGEYALTYLFRGTGSNGAIFVYVFDNTTDFKLIAVSEGNVIVTSDNLTETDELYANVMAYPFYTAGSDSFLTSASVSTEDDTTVYTVISVPSGYDPGYYTLKITVVTENGVGKVTNIELAHDGWADGYEEEAPQESANILITGLVGATSATVDSMYESGMIAGASQSARIITAAVKAALAHYDANLAN